MLRRIRNPWLLCLFLSTAALAVAGCAVGGNGNPDDDDDVVVDDGGGGDPDGGGGGNPDGGGGGNPDGGGGGNPDGGGGGNLDGGGGPPDAAPSPDGGFTGDGLGPWTGNDHVAPSQDPPFGLAPSEVPQFVIVGFDDNAYSGLEGSNGTGGVTWATSMIASRDNADGSPARLSFYLTTIYIAQWQSESPTYVKRSWHTAMTDQNEVGDHTQSHSHGAAFDVSQWENEIQTCLDWLQKPFDPNEVTYDPDATKGIGASLSNIYGFRTPFLEYNDATLQVVNSKSNFWYDASIEDGYEYDHDGSNFYWPYTLDEGSPGHDILVKWGQKEPITPHAGLWEMPVYPVIVPPDDKCAEYGVPTGLRAKMQQHQSWFDTESGKITGFDYNLWVSFSMTKAEFLATLKYSLDQRLAGNRAPFTFGAHTDYYSSKYTAVPNATLAERQQAIEEFIDYARAKQMVRVTSAKQALDWIRNPSPL